MQTPRRCYRLIGSVFLISTQASMLVLSAMGARDEDADSQIPVLRLL